MSSPEQSQEQQQISHEVQMDDNRDQEPWRKAEMPERANAPMEPPPAPGHRRPELIWWTNRTTTSYRAAVGRTQILNGLRAYLDSSLEP